MTWILHMFHRTFIPALIIASATSVEAQTTCPAVNLVTTPWILPPAKMGVGALMQSDGSFTGYYAPHFAPFLYTSLPNIQTQVTSCYSKPTKKGSAPLPLYNAVGYASYLGSAADLDGDGVADAVLIAYKPVEIFEVLMAASGVPKPGYPVGIATPAPPLSIRVVDVNKDGKPDLVFSAADNPNGTPVSSIYVMLNTGNGTFGPATRYPAGTEPLGFAVIDVNGDGNLDLVVADQGGRMDPAREWRFCSVTAPVDFLPPRILLAWSRNRWWSGTSMAMEASTRSRHRFDDQRLSDGTNGKGNGTFVTKVTFPSGGDSVYLAMGDFNRDGKLDLASSNYNEQTASVLLNNDTGSAVSFQAAVSY